jgi:TfoX/Sxy family transcriptional regulator of competence genes
LTTRETVEELAEPLHVFGEVRIKPMFGEWGVYVGEKFAAIVGDGRLFLKVKGVPAETVATLFGGYTEPYPGAKNYAEVSPARFTDEAWVSQVQAELIAESSFCA